MMDNIFIRLDSAGNIKADKEKSTEKIDGAVAMIMGLDRAIRCGNEISASVYDERGILFCKACQTISSLENGRYNPSITLAFRIARLFNMSIEDIFIYEEDTEHEKA